MFRGHKPTVSYKFPIRDHHIKIALGIRVSNVPNWASDALVERMPVDASIEKYSVTLLSWLLSVTMEYPTSTV